MFEQRKNTNEDKSKAAANVIIQRKNNEKSKASITDNRPVTQLKRVLINGVLTNVPDDYVVQPSQGRRLDGAIGEPQTNPENNLERNKEVRRLSYEAALLRQQQARERGMPRIKQERESDESFHNQLILTGNSKAIYDRMGPFEKWREHIDGRHQQHGREVYTKALHGKDPDPDYNKNMLEADRSISNTFGRRFNARDFHEAHKATFSDPTEFGTHFRKGPLDINYRGFKSPIDKLRLEHREDPLIDSFNTPNIETPNHTVKLADPTKHPSEMVQDILNQHYENIGLAESSDDKFQAIAKTHKNLENLHPYVDHNSRVNRLVLNRLLAEQGMAPAILENPLDVHHSDMETWSDSIKSGQEKWLSHVRRLGDQTDEWQELNKRSSMAKRFSPSISHEEIINEFMRK